MQPFNDFVCEDCPDSFKSASDLLKHFAVHAAQSLVLAIDHENTSKSKKPKIPDLYPIAGLKLNKFETNCNNKEKSECEDNVDSGFEDINPMKFCLVTMDAGLAVKCAQMNLKTDDDLAPTALKRYKCSYCSKAFGWSTDLKRHILIHTGERPFKCQSCKSSFTRNFLLQKHKLKYHSAADVVKIKVPGLKPIDVGLKEKARKQDKCKIKRKSCKTKNLYQSEFKNNLIYTM